MMTLRIKQGATFPLTFTIRDENGNPVDLSGLTTRLIVRHLDVYAEPITLTHTRGEGIGELVYVLPPDWEVGMHYFDADTEEGDSVIPSPSGEYVIVRILSRTY